MKKVLLAPILAITSLCFAEYCEHCEDDGCEECGHEYQENCYEEHSDDYCSSCCEEHPSQCINRVSHTPQFYDLNCDWGLFFTAEFLYFYGKERNLGYGSEAVAVPDLSSNTTGSFYFNKMEYLDTKWYPGVRVGAGWNMECDGWDLYFVWTYYYNRSKRTKSVDELLTSNWPTGTVALTSQWIDGSIFSSPIPIFDTISGRWKTKLNQFDLELGRRYWLSSCFTLRPFMGLRGGWDDTDFQVDASSTFLINNQNQGITQTAAIKFDNDFWGVGFIGGIQPNWYFTPCFSLYGSFDIALLWSQYKMKRNATYVRSITIGSPSGDQINLSTPSKLNYYAMQSILDLELGLRFETTFCDRRYSSSLDFGWEHHIWFNHNPRILTDQNGRTASETEHDFVFGGFVLRARLDF